jgi:hypothetical protein
MRPKGSATAADRHSSCSLRTICQLILFLALEWLPRCPACRRSFGQKPQRSEDPTLASLSIGASRVFVVAHKTRARPGHADLELTLNDGDLVIMRGPSTTTDTR